MKIGIIGAGLIGGKRAASISAVQNDAKLIAVTDLAHDRAQKLAQAYDAHVEKNWESLIARKDIDTVIVATANGAIVPCAIAALKAGKNVLVEKPAGKNPVELQELLKVSQASQGIVRVGFNHRFHPGLQKAKKLIQEGAIGPLMYIRARYGHGGRIGYDKEWRADPNLGGGGELLDQGVHLIDLCRWLGGEFDLEYGRASTFFWDMPVEDNGFLLLRSPDKKASAFLHASCTEWKNLFDFEIFGLTGKLQIWGLGRSYGTEELRYYKMLPQMGPPETKIESFPGEDLSWNLEFQAFQDEVTGKKTDIANVSDALKAVQIVYDTYKLSGLSWAK